MPGWGWAGLVLGPQWLAWVLGLWGLNRRHQGHLTWAWHLCSWWLAFALAGRKPGFAWATWWWCGAGSGVCGKVVCTLHSPSPMSKVPLSMLSCRAGRASERGVVGNVKCLSCLLEPITFISVLQPGAITPHMECLALVKVFYVKMVVQTDVSRWWWVSEIPISPYCWCHSHNLLHLSFIIKYLNHYQVLSKILESLAYKHTLKNNLSVYCN